MPCSLLVASLAWFRRDPGVVGMLPAVKLFLLRAIGVIGVVDAALAVRFRRNSALDGLGDFETSMTSWGPSSLHVKLFLRRTGVLLLEDPSIA